MFSKDIREKLKQTWNKLTEEVGVDDEAIAPAQPSHDPQQVREQLKKLLASGQWKNAFYLLLEQGFEKAEITANILKYYRNHPEECPDELRAKVFPQALPAQAKPATRKSEEPRLPPSMRSQQEPEVEFGNWQETIRSFTGLYFLGDPGTGKTCSMKKFFWLILQELGEAEITIVDLHNHPGKWDDLKVIDDIDEAINWMRWMREVDLESRKQALKEGRKMPLKIWAIDEVGALQRGFDDKADDLAAESKIAQIEGDRLLAAEIMRESVAMKKLLGRFLIGLGVEGRKFGYLGICANQVANVSGSGMQGQGDALEAYTKCFMGRVAIKWSNILGVEPSARKWLERQAYPCLLDGRPVKHLTHGDYQKREREQPPIGMPTLRSLPPAEVPEMPKAERKRSDDDGYDYRSALKRSLKLAFELKSDIKKRVIEEVLGFKSRDYTTKGQQMFNELMGDE